MTDNKPGHINGSACYDLLELLAVVRLSTYDTRRYHYAISAPRVRRLDAETIGTRAEQWEHARGPSARGIMKP